MRGGRFVTALLLFAASLLWAQNEEFAVYTEAPRLLLRPARLRLTQRERERQSIRWQQFDSLITGGANIPEPGFAYALHYRVAQQPAIGKQAVDWALSEKANPSQPGHLRQLAMVYDWCQPMMSPQELDRLGAKIERGLTTPAGFDIRAQPVEVAAARAFAASALADRLPDHGSGVIKPIVVDWWREGVVAKLKSGGSGVPRESVYALFELLHVIRDTVQIDLRDDARDFFHELPTDHLVSHYPAPIVTAENLFRIPIYVRNGEPQLNDSVLSRAAEFAMVAYDSNAAENQFLQGWLMQDRYIMRGALGSPYEFLWANPYQPGLSYFQVPLVYHNAESGHLFARTSWDDDATWLGYFEGNLQLFKDGQVQTLRRGAVADPVRVGDALILPARTPGPDGFVRFRAEAEAIFVIGLAPRSTYTVEIDDQELREESTDTGGTLVIGLPENVAPAVRIRKTEN